MGKNVFYKTSPRIDIQVWNPTLVDGRQEQQHTTMDIGKGGMKMMRSCGILDN